MAQAAALQDLAALTAGGKAEAWRRRAIFDDDTGAAWQAPVRACLDEVLPCNKRCRCRNAGCQAGGCVRVHMSMVGVPRAVEVQMWVMQADRSSVDRANPRKFAASSCVQESMCGRAEGPCIALACMLLSRCAHALVAQSWVPVRWRLWWTLLGGCCRSARLRRAEQARRPVQRRVGTQHPLLRAYALIRALQIYPYCMRNALLA